MRRSQGHLRGRRERRRTGWFRRFVQPLRTNVALRTSARIGVLAIERGKLKALKDNTHANSVILIDDSACRGAD